MAIVLENVTLFTNYHTPLQKKIISKLNMTIEMGTINAICGNEIKSEIAKLICFINRPSLGSIKYNSYVMNHNNHINNINKIRKDIAYISYLPDNYLFNKTVQDELIFNLKKYNYRINDIPLRLIQALKIVGLNEDYLSKEIKSLSLSDQKRVMLASILIYNPQVLIFDNIEIGMTKKEQLNLIRLIKKINYKYHKTIIFLSNNLDFLINVVDKYYFLNNNSLDKVINKDELFTIDIPLYMKESSIINIIKLARYKNSHLDNYYEINELIKGVFRDVR